MTPEEKVLVLKELADEWQFKGWNDVLFPLPEGFMGPSQAVLEWLRAKERELYPLITIEHRDSLTCQAETIDECPDMSHWRPVPTSYLYPTCTDHNETQHQDRKPPWCNKCGWNRGKPAVPPRKIGEPRVKLPE